MKIDNHKLNLLLAERCMSITELRSCTTQQTGPRRMICRLIST